MKTKIILQSLNFTILQNYIFYIRNVFLKRNIFLKTFYLPLKKKKIVLLKSPHVNKTALEHFELNFFKVYLVIPNNFIIHKDFNFILLNKPKVLTITIKKE